MLLCRGGVGRQIALRLLDAGLLAGEVAEVEDACATYFSDLVEFNLFNRRRLEGENPLYSYSVGDLADGEGLHAGGCSANLYHYAAEALEPVLVTLLDLVGDRDCVSCLELGIILSPVLGERLLY